MHRNPTQFFERLLELEWPERAVCVTPAPLDPVEAAPLDNPAAFDVLDVVVGPHIDDPAFVAFRIDTIAAFIRRRDWVTAAAILLSTARQKFAEFRRSRAPVQALTQRYEPPKRRPLMRIGQEFVHPSTGARWRVTDVGSRTFAAISMTGVDGDLREPSWLSGPPYALEEVVWDETDYSLLQEIDGIEWVANEQSSG